MTVEQDVQRFKVELLRKMPFYGDIAYANKRAKKTGVNSNVSF